METIILFLTCLLLVLHNISSFLPHYKQLLSKHNTNYRRSISVHHKINTSLYKRCFVLNESTDSTRSSYEDGKDSSSSYRVLHGADYISLYIIPNTPVSIPKATISNSDQLATATTLKISIN